MGRKITEKEYEVHYYEVDYRKKALMTSLIDYFNDIATYQSETLGIGIEYMIKNNMAWILYKWDIHVEKYPSYGDKIIVKTEPCGANKFYAYRKFEIRDCEGNILARANSIWLLIDIKERKPIRVSEDLLEAYGIKENNEIIKIQDVKKLCKIENTIEFKTRYSDIDTNGHVNNEKYAAWLIESVPLDIVLNYTLTNIKIIYKKETKYGESIKIETDSVFGDDKMVFSHKIVNKDEVTITLGETVWQKNKL